jgi:hypothetical protein
MPMASGCSLAACFFAVALASLPPPLPDRDGGLPSMPHEQQLADEMFESFSFVETSSTARVTVTTLMRDTVKIKQIQASALRTTGLADLLVNAGVDGLSAPLVFAINTLMKILNSVISFGFAIVGKRWAAGDGADKRKHASIYKFAKELLVRTVSSVILLVLESSDKVMRLMVSTGTDVTAYLMLFYQWCVFISTIVFADRLAIVGLPLLPQLNLT